MDGERARYGAGDQDKRAERQVFRSHPDAALFIRPLVFDHQNVIRITDRPDIAKNKPIEPINIDAATAFVDAGDTVNQSLNDRLLIQHLFRDCKKIIGKHILPIASAAAVGQSWNNQLEFTSIP